MGGGHARWTVLAALVAAAMLASSCARTPRARQARSFATGTVLGALVGGAAGAGVAGLDCGVEPMCTASFARPMLGLAAVGALAVGVIQLELARRDLDAEQRAEQERWTTGWRGDLAAAVAVAPPGYVSTGLGRGADRPAPAQTAAPAPRAITAWTIPLGARAASLSDGAVRYARAGDGEDGSAAAACGAATRAAFDALWAACTDGGRAGVGGHTLGEAACACAARDDGVACQVTAEATCARWASDAVAVGVAWGASRSVAEAAAIADARRRCMRAGAEVGSATSACACDAELDAPGEACVCFADMVCER